MSSLSLGQRLLVQHGTSPFLVRRHYYAAKAFRPMSNCHLPGTILQPLEASCGSLAILQRALLGCSERAALKGTLVVRW